MTIAAYPGTFDPITCGHVDVARRASRVFSQIVIGVYEKPDKKVLFSTDERVALAKEALKDLTNVTVQKYSGLTVEFAREVGAQVIVRGLRFGGDFEHEFNMAMMNKRLDEDLEMVCFMSSPAFQFLSSSLLKEVYKLGADISQLVPFCVSMALINKTGD
ncbi:MAG: pantetheine-phosphate adenylyltransferase [Chloroflexi bacterium]|nr:pantetheine-phosphate adenylyltransferase [Chloroflexota bacterium]